MLRRIALTAAVSLAALVAVPGAASADGPQPGAQAPIRQAPDQLTVTVANSGVRTAEGTYQLQCGPDGATGTHRSPQEACDRLAALAADGEQPFAPVPKGLMCTMQYGGPATAHITGTWQGQPVDATFRRTNGCEISRWNNLVPVLPHAAL
ncbi:SSI family serine proteinase inhibitor [Streptomyces sp. NPDC051322]|uniref:SSI family serine proteinase inhibitor n=1 Tax=Streptomyces sp. NPDC051322 TaxID=3154645 RepID=UPI00344EFB93